MVAIQAQNDNSQTGKQLLWFWAPIVLGLFALYGPSYVDFVTDNLVTDEQRTQSYIVVAFVGWLLWSNRAAALLISREPSITLAAGAWIGLGAVGYIVGRSQEVGVLEFGSQLPILWGLSRALLTDDARKKIAIPIAFLLFMLPLPGSLLDVILLPLKDNVSSIVEWVLYHVGYPIARSGVVLSIGPYQLLIADACSGLNSMIALSGVGLAYVYLTQSPYRWKNIALIVCILPIAFFANFLRVTCLVLVTYYFGDAIGQRFHDVAGMAEVLFAFMAFFALDSLLDALFLRASKPK